MNFFHFVSKNFWRGLNHTAPLLITPFGTAKMRKNEGGEGTEAKYSWWCSSQSILRERRPLGRVRGDPRRNLSSFMKKRISGTPGIPATLMRPARCRTWRRSDFFLAGTFVDGRQFERDILFIRNNSIKHSTYHVNAKRRC